MVQWATGDIITAEKLNAMQTAQAVVVSVVVECEDNAYVTKSSSHTWEQIKALLENNISVMAIVTEMDGDAPADHYGLVYTDSAGYGDYSYIVFHGIKQYASDENTYALFTLSFDVETGAYFSSKGYVFTPAT